MKKSAFFSDILFAFFLSSLFTLCVFRYFKLSLPLALVLSVVCGMLAAGAVGAILQSKRKTLFLKKSDEREKERLLTHLSLLSDEEKTKYFQTAFSKLGASVKRSGALRLFSDDAFYFLRFHFAPVTADEVANAARWKTAKTKRLLCSEIEENAAALCKKLNIELWTGEKIYAALKENEALPAHYRGEENAQTKGRNKPWIRFPKRSAKAFSSGGALLLVSSLFTPFPYYYLVIGSLLLLSAVFIRIFGSP